MNIDNVPYNLDWGPVTPDGYDRGKNEALWIVNFNLSTKEQIFRVTNFLIGEIVWAKLNLPDGCIERIIIDISGQRIGLEELRNIKLAIEREVGEKSPGHFIIQFKGD